MFTNAGDSKGTKCSQILSKVGETCKDAFEKLLKVYGEDCTSRTQVYECFLRILKMGVKVLRGRQIVLYCS